MADLVEAPPADLLEALAYALMQQRPALRRIGKLPSHIPLNDECHAIAAELVRHLERSGVEKILRRRLTSHGMPVGRRS